MNDLESPPPVDEDRWRDLLEESAGLPVRPSDPAQIVGRARRRRLLRRIATGAVTVAILAAAGTTLALTRHDDSPSIADSTNAAYRVPELRGLPLPQAAAILRDLASASPVVTYAPSTSAPVGVVLSQSPMAGSRVRARARISLTVSSGHSTDPLPTLLTIVNRTVAGWCSRSHGLGTSAEVGPGKRVTFDSAAACAYSSIDATWRGGAELGTFTEPCSGQTWSLFGPGHTRVSGR